LNAAKQQHRLARLARFGRAIENGLLVTLFCVLITFASAQIVFRNVFSIGFTWGDGLIRVIVLWLALLGALAAGRDGRHITMGALTRWLPGRYAAAAELAADVFAAVVSAAFAYYSFVFVRDSRAFGDVLLGDLPAWWMQSIMPVAFGLLAYRYVVQAAKRIRSF
jgi:TRAP-type C4-dicarboxylate transport system permease small subunit